MSSSQEQWLCFHATFEVHYLHTPSCITRMEKHPVLMRHVPSTCAEYESSQTSHLQDYRDLIGNMYGKEMLAQHVH